VDEEEVKLCAIGEEGDRVREEDGRKIYYFIF
jgi:hypothetical protein